MTSGRSRCFFWIFLLFSVLIYSDFHPEIKWKEISGEKFTVIFPEGYREYADYSLHAARELYPVIQAFWKSDVGGKIRILLYDSTDCFDEESTFFPYNQIRISMYPPEPHSIFGNYTDHIKDVIRHGLNRIFVYNQGSRALRFFRKYFGTNSVFFPTIFIPGWTLAGVSAFEEINTEDETRFHSPEFSLILNRLAAGKGFPDIGSLKSRLSIWPGQFSNIIFGAGLIKFISGTIPGDKIREFVRHYSANPIPVGFKGIFNPRFLTMAERFKIVFGKKIGDVWREMEREQEKTPGPAEKMFMLTNSGFIKKYPIYIPDIGTVYYSKNFRRFPGLFILEKGRKGERKLIRREAVKGISYSGEEGVIYFSAVEIFRKYYRYADLFRYDLKKKTVRRLTRGKRLTYPVRSGDRIYCIQREKDGSRIVWVRPDGSDIHRISEKYMYITGLTISPDSRYLAASVKTGEGNWKIGVFDRRGGLNGFLEYGGERAFSPEWKNRSELMFITSLEKRFGLASYNMDLGQLVLYKSDPFPNFKYFGVVDEKTIVAPVLTGKGYDISMIDLEDFKPEVRPYSFSPVYPERRASIRPAGITEGEYHPFRDLVPKYFTLMFREGGNEVQAGITASGFDLLHRNHFKLRLLSGLRSGKVNAHFDYSYNGFPFTLNLRYSKYTDMNRDEVKGGFFKVADKLVLSALIPLSVTREGAVHLYTDIHFERDTDDYVGDFENSVTDFNGLRAGLQIHATREYYNSISQNDGFNFNAMLSREFELLGSNGDLTLFSLEYSQFIPVGGINTFALRAAFGTSRGDGQREFLMGGVSSGEEKNLSGEKLFGILRGYPSGFFRGDTGFSLNMEYRFLITKIERSFLIFKSVESLYATLFTDMGSVWQAEGRAGSLIMSAGVELNLILYLGSYKYILSSGLGYGFSQDRDPVVYFRLGASF